MNPQRLPKMIFVSFLISSLNLVTSLHLNLTGEQNLPESVKTLNSATNLSSDPLSASNGNATLSNKIELPDISSFFPNPNLIAQKINNTIQDFIQKLNNTISSKPGFSSVQGHFKNISKFPFTRLEDADLLFSNISSLARNSDPNNDSPSTSSLIDSLQEAYNEFSTAVSMLMGSAEPSQSVHPTTAERKFDVVSGDIGKHESGLRLKTTNSSRSSNIRSLRRMWDQIHAQVDSNIQDSVANTRARLEDSLSVARQGSLLMRNRTMNFMSEIQKVFNVFMDPFKRIFQDIRGKLPTTVVTA